MIQVIMYHVAIILSTSEKFLYAIYFIMSKKNFFNRWNLSKKYFKKL